MPFPEFRFAMNLLRSRFALSLSCSLSVAALRAEAPAPMPRLAYNNPGLVTDLGVGLWAWPLPMDWNGDGLIDLVVVCTDVPSNGTYVFLNSGRTDPPTGLPLFEPAVPLGSGAAGRVPGSPQISYVAGKPVITTPGRVYPDFRDSGFDRPATLPAAAEIVPGPGSIRAKQWRYVDYDGDGRTDLVVGIDYWGEYGWDNAWDSQGRWKNGPLHGYVYLLRNTGTDAQPVYAEPVKLTTADGRPIDTYGMPSPSFADFRGTGKLDLICGEFIDGFTFYENIGTRTEPRYAPGRRLTAAGRPLAMELCMITPVAVDFNGDGRVDLVVGDEDGRVAFLENTGAVVDGMPQFLPPRYFRQFAADVKFGALVSPVTVDWDGDGQEDIVAGDSAGHLCFIKNLGGNPPRWAAPVLLAAEGKTIRELAGPNGSIQGPAEAKWGYSNISVADWDGDGLPDILTNGIWGKIVWYKNTGTRTAPKLAAARPVEVAWTGPTPKPAWNWWAPAGRELVTQWRSTPLAIDWNGDGLMDLVTLDPEGYLALYERRRTASGALELLPPQRVFRGEGVSEFDSAGQPLNRVSGPLRLNAKPAGGSGRRTFTVFDWDGDGIPDLLVNSKPNVNFLKGLGRNADGQWVFRDEGPVNAGHVLAGHSTTPAVARWGGGAPELLIGAEDGFFHRVPAPRR